MRLLILLGLLLAAAPLAAQDAEREVLGVVKQLFDGMRGRDTAKMRAQLHPDARMASPSLRNGTVSVTVESPDRWLASVAGATAGMLDERITSALVKVDGALASVWASYTFYLARSFPIVAWTRFTWYACPQAGGSSIWRTPGDARTVPPAPIRWAPHRKKALCGCKGRPGDPSRASRILLFMPRLSGTVLLGGVLMLGSTPRLMAQDSAIPAIDTIMARRYFQEAAALTARDGDRSRLGAGASARVADRAGGAEGGLDGEASSQ